MSASYSDWPVAAFVVPRQRAEELGHDIPEPPSREQQAEWIQQLDDEQPEIPFTDEDS